MRSRRNDQRGSLLGLQNCDLRSELVNRSLTTVPITSRWALVMDGRVSKRCPRRWAAGVTPSSRFGEEFSCCSNTLCSILHSMHLSYTSAVILQAVQNGYGYGFTIMDVTGMPSGTVYPALRRLEEARYVRSRWESETTALKEQRPARKNYELTRAGAQELAQALKRYRLLATNPLARRMEGPEHA